MVEVKVRTRIETVTPEVAIKWLEKNTDNRILNQRIVDLYARDMANGRWHLTGEPIIFDANGVLLNGQHRLWACIEGGQAFETAVTRGVDPAARIVVDTGRKRTLGNLLTMRGLGDGPQLAATVNVVYRYDRSRFQGLKVNPTHEEALDWMERNPLVRESIRIAHRLQTSLPALTKTATSAAHFVNFRVDAEPASLFWEKVADGSGLPAGDAIIALNRWAMLSAAGRDRVSTEVQFAVCMKAMRAWYEGKSVRALGFRPSQEEIPEPWDPKKRKVTVPA